MSAPVFVCFSRFLWRDRWETSRHHLVRGLARRYRTVYVEPAPNLGRLLRGLSDRSALLELRRPVDEPPLRVVRPPRPELPLEPFAVSRPLFDHLRRAEGRAQAACVGPFLPQGSPLVLFNSFYPARALGAVEALRPQLFVYHSTDNIAELAHGGSRGAMALAATEREAAARADLVVASSEVLAELLTAVNPATELLANGVDAENFAPALHEGPIPDDLPPGPRLFFVGNVEGRRLDVDLLCALAAYDRSWAVVLVGPVGLPAPLRARLAAEPNVHLLGARPRARLADYLRAADVCLIPYRENPLTRAIYPLKLNEYLAAGRPVVATPFSPSLAGFAGVVDVAPASEFADAVKAVVDNPGRMAPSAVAARVAAAAANSWEARVERLAQLVEARL